MISIYKSHNLHHLAGQLADRLEESKNVDPFKPQQIIVPNLDTSRWLKLELAERMGVAANFDFILPAEWQYRQIRELYPDLPRQLPSDPDSMRWTIFGVLMDDQLRKAFPKPNRYINSQSSEMKDQAAMQLARQISSVYDQYLMYRPEMILEWQNGKSCQGDEKWQAELWILLNKTWKKQNESDLQLNKAELHNHTITAVENGTLKPDGPIYVFNPGLIPKPIVRLLQVCRSHSDLFVYNIHPSKNPVTDEGNELLQSFGEEAGNVEELFQLLDGELTRDFRFDAKTDNSLHRVQKHIIDNQPMDVASGKTKLEDNIQVRSCHSPLREIETLHQFLLEQFEKNSDLHPDDILVVTPDLQVYEPAIDAVFGIPEEGMPSIPYHLGSIRSNDSESLERAFTHLLSLPDSRFTLSEVMDLFQMKPVREKLGLSESDCQKVKRWIEENHVMWALDGDHRKEWGQPAEEMQTWYSALKRTWLGQWMDDQGGKLLGGAPLYTGVRSSGDQEVWAAFTRFLGRLDSVRQASKKKTDCLAWCDHIRQWMDMFFTADDLQGRAGLSIVMILDTLKDAHKLAAVSRDIPFGLIRQEITSLLDQQMSGSTLFTRGVTFSTMVPVRSLPFKVVALIGLNEDKFPRKTTSPDFDLMAQHPEPSDRNRKKEDRNLFLESILAAEEIHYCSYVGRSPFDNESIPPSPIVSEWLDTLEKVTGQKPENIIQLETLNGFSPDLFREGGGSYSSLYFNTAKSLSEKENGFSGLMNSEPLPDEGESGEIDINELIRFFSNPMKYFLNTRFDARLYDPDEEKNEFEFNHLEKHTLFQRLFGCELSDINKEELLEQLVNSGMLPSGWPGRSVLNETEGHVKTAFEQIKSKDFTPIINLVQISTELNDNKITGSIYSFSNICVLNIVPSKFSGKTVIQSWLQHLAVCASDEGEKRESYLLTELKKGKPKWFKFNPVMDAKKQLQEFVEIYKSGLNKPVHFFPKTMVEFEERTRNNRSKDPLENARNEFEGGFKKRGESDDLAISFLMGDQAKFDEQFVQGDYQKLVEMMMDNMEDFS